MLGWTPLAPVAKTEGKVENFGAKEMVPATAEIISVQASDMSTILTWLAAVVGDGHRHRALRSTPFTVPGSSPIWFD